MELALTEGTFRAFGTSCRVVADLASGAIESVARRADDLESRWSRFRPDSEVSQCNDAAGRAVPVSAITVDLFERANRAAARTAGRFNALLLRDLVAIGYDRSHEHLAAPAHAAVPAANPAVVDRRIDLVEIGPDGVRIPAHAQFDPGGIGKGLAADLLLADLLDAGARWAFVSLGGDMRFGGEALAEAGAAVAIEDPWNVGTSVGEVSLHGGAVASSSVLRRRWSADGTDRHHLLEPTTRRPSGGSRVATTVHARDGWWADVVAKCALIDDTVDAAQMAEWGCAGLAFTTDRSLVPLGWEAIGEAAS